MLIGMMEEMICWNIGSVLPKIGTVKNLIRFFDMDECKGEDVKTKGIPGINIEDVSFVYPGSTKNSLSHVSFDIKPGETVAIVGENGAGKSTLVRLLIGIYFPTKGKVEFNGHDTRYVSKGSIFKNTSGVFQKFQKYKMTLDENISISDTTSNVSSSRINAAVKKAALSVSVDKFPEGYGTMLSREFDGVDLSGGEWQRIAIARGFYKSHNMIILDEPTASIDPIEETKLYKKFKEMSDGKTSIIVTHRLGSAKIADKIIVLDKGRIVQLGTHDELISINGEYKDMYKSQSKWYISN
ncbi:ABC transporter ATP-binding protein/permease [Clostridium sp. CF011]|uniref:ABC transporter ATP-binding protein n=1 Tax=Clostridium sp. CF011 TaxID=2843318 RepID=UPI001C0D004B|nr:ABC transporter ATP-binding protein [Clostridium sp. CF011]MBU3092894.1 ABC transporter ATP-binding protein/permease [Clostridium sp. CF011]WAG71062.1 ABC transporter ATP-binding protein/permease [Clostridium sp. CF011]